MYARKNRRSNQEWTTQRNWQHWVHMTQVKDKQSNKHNTENLKDEQHILHNTEVSPCARAG